MIRMIWTGKNYTVVVCLFFFFFFCMSYVCFGFYFNLLLAEVLVPVFTWQLLSRTA